LPVGPDGVIKSMVGLAAATRPIGGNNPSNMGLYAIEDLQRVYRLEPQRSIDAILRVDQGSLADLFRQNPQATLNVNLAVVAAPRVLDAQHYGAGVGGLLLQPGEFRRMGFPLGAQAEWDRLAQEVTALKGDKQLIRIDIADAALAGPGEDAWKAKLSGALAALARASEAPVRAALVRGLPPAGISAELEKAAEALAHDPDPLVRLMWAQRAGKIAQSGGAAGDKAAEALRQQDAAEKDPLVKQYLDVRVAAMKGVAQK
jgi:hypothetical protein